jgi:hypothetical protein
MNVVQDYTMSEERCSDGKLILYVIYTQIRSGSKILPPFINIKCFSFVKQMYLDIF